jgi:hypothetical protein
MLVVATLGVVWINWHFARSAHGFARLRWVVLAMQGRVAGETLSSRNLRVRLRFSHSVPLPPGSIGQLNGKLTGVAVSADEPINSYHVAERPPGTAPTGGALVDVPLSNDDAAWLLPGQHVHFVTTGEEPTAVPPGSLAAKHFTVVAVGAPGSKETQIRVMAPPELLTQDTFKLLASRCRPLILGPGAVVKGEPPRPVSDGSKEKLQEKQKKRPSP